MFHRKPAANSGAGPKQSTLSFSNKPIQRPGLLSTSNRPGPGKLLSASTVNSISSRPPPVKPTVNHTAPAPQKPVQRSSLGKRPAGSQEALRQALQSENSFGEQTVIDLDDDKAPVTAKDNLKNAISFVEDEFEFDDELELSTIEWTSARPPKQTPAKPAPATASTTVQPNKPVATATTTVAPKNAPSATNNAWNKQFQTTEAPPPKKRRTLPWKTQQQEAELAKLMNPPPKPIETPHTAATVSTSSGSNLPWNKSASAVKAAKLDFKGKLQQKRAISTASLGGSSDAKDGKRGSKATRYYMSNEQVHVLDMVVNEGKSVFFTGSAGTGKSVLLREIIQGLRKKHKNYDSVAITASTGLAACNIGGVTLHSFAGIGLGRETVEQLVKKIRRVPKNKQRWLRTKVLIIDEISMVDGDLFDKLEGVARMLKNNGRPFGGIQIVVTGDFFQLPPVPDNGKMAKFAFEANTWTNCVDHTILLTHIFRQKDPVFASMLNEMRLGNLSPASIASFKKLNRPLKFDDGLQATELFPTRREVDNANNRQLRELKSGSEIYTAMDDSPILDQQQRDKLLANCMAPQALELKLGAQVMLIKNMDETLVNGSLGRIVAFMSEKTYAMVAEDLPGGEDLLFGSQGEPRDIADMTTKERASFERYRNEQSNTNTAKKYPLVQWSIADGTQRRTLMLPEAWKFELPTGEVQASRKQVPLILAWALSIHKAQGQTLDRVKVDLNKVFEKGQAYVALSRATTQEGLQVLNFDARKVMAHEKVRGFYRSLTSAEAAVAAAAAPAPPIKASNSSKVDLEDDFPDDEEFEMAMQMNSGGGSKMKTYA